MGELVMKAQRTTRIGLPHPLTNHPLPGGVMLINPFNWMERRWLGPIPLAITLLLPACTSDTNMEPTTGPIIPEETEAEPTDSISLIVTNDSEKPICFFYLAAAEQE